MDEQRQQDAQEGDGAGMLLLAQIAEAVEARHLEHLGKGKKRKDADTESQDAAASEKNGTQVLIPHPCSEQGSLFFYGYCVAAMGIGRSAFLVGGMRPVCCC